MGVGEFLDANSLIDECSSDDLKALDGAAENTLNRSGTETIWVGQHPSRYGWLHRRGERPVGEQKLSDARGASL